MTQTFTITQDGKAVGEVTVTVDMQAIALRLGNKVIKSKTGKAVTTGGAVKVTHVRPKPTRQNA